MRSDTGVWVVGAVALIALVVFGGLWLMQSSLLSRLDGIARDDRRRTEKLQNRVVAMQKQLKELQGRLDPADSAPAAPTAAAPTPARVTKGQAAADEPENAPTKAAEGDKTYVRLTSKPARARVKRDGRTLGRTPLVLPLQHGEKVNLLLTRRGYVSREVSITGGAETAMQVELKRPKQRTKPDKDEPTLFDPYAN